MRARRIRRAQPSQHLPHSPADSALIAALRTATTISALTAIATLAAAPVVHAQTYTASTLYSFTGTGTGGKYALSGLTADSKGDLFGTTSGGGSGSDGTVFEETNTGTLANPVYGAASTVYSFTGTGTSGASPEAGLTIDSSGNLYGTTYQGGGSGGGAGDGTVFKLTNTGTAASPTYGAPTTLYSFSGTGADGANPKAALTLDSSGDLFGTTNGGGSSSNDGTVFELTNTGTVASPTFGSASTLYSFTGTGTSGALPYAGLTLDSSGDLYGTTGGGGSSGFGTVFELKVSGSASAPEPGSLALLALGLTGGLPLAGIALRRRGRAA